MPWTNTDAILTRKQRIKELQNNAWILVAGLACLWISTEVCHILVNFSFLRFPSTTKDYKPDKILASWNDPKKERSSLAVAKVTHLLSITGLNSDPALEPAWHDLQKSSDCTYTWITTRIPVNYYDKIEELVLFSYGKFCFTTLYIVDVHCTESHNWSENSFLALPLLLKWLEGKASTKCRIKWKGSVQCIDTWKPP